MWDLHAKVVFEACASSDKNLEGLGHVQNDAITGTVKVEVGFEVEVKESKLKEGFDVEEMKVDVEMEDVEGKDDLMDVDEV